MSCSWNSYKGERARSEESSAVVAERILVDLKCRRNGAISIDLDKKRRFLRFIVVEYGEGILQSGDNSGASAPASIYCGPT